MIRWQRGPLRGHGEDPKEPPQLPEHWTAWEGERHVGSVVRLGEGRWTMHRRKPGGGWEDCLRVFMSAAEAMTAFGEWVDGE